MPRGIAVSDEVKEEIVAMRGKGGLMPADIAKELGLTTQLVYNVLNEAGMSAAVVTNIRQHRSTPLDSPAIDALIRRYQDGDNVSKIAEDAEISIPFMYDILREHGISTRQAAQLEGRQQAIEDACVMYKEGEPLWKINEATHVSNFTLNRELHKRGIPLRRPRSRQ